ncbi:peroxidase 45-like [Panicum miliaceum]|uniref:Peroxidase 45-like n=1 Tax=Panicum miliaceum TaxID=4540 RepID=A0A3L6TQN5_PANMI|nr:peroxidase 45-like [Panicum miliaceum]
MPPPPAAQAAGHTGHGHARRHGMSRIEGAGIACCLWRVAGHGRAGTVRHQLATATGAAAAGERAQGGQPPLDRVAAARRPGSAQAGRAGSAPAAPPATAVLSGQPPLAASPRLAGSPPAGDDEWRHNDNQSLKREGFLTVLSAKAAVDSDPQCRNKVSCADILALAARESVVQVPS